MRSGYRWLTNSFHWIFFWTRLPIRGEKVIEFKILSLTMKAFYGDNEALEIATSYLTTTTSTDTTLSSTSAEMEFAEPNQESHKSPYFDLYSLEMGQHPITKIRLGDSLEHLTTTLGPLPNDYIVDANLDGGLKVYHYDNSYYAITDNEPRHVDELSMLVDKEESFNLSDVINIWGEPVRYFEDLSDFRRNDLYIRLFYDPHTKEVSQIAIRRVQ